MDPLPHPVQYDWWMSYSVLSTQIISFICVTTNVESLYQRCVTYELQVVWQMFGNTESTGFSWIVHTHWQIQFEQICFCKKLHCTFWRLLTIAVARQEHPDRLWASPNILFSPYLGLSGRSTKATACTCRQYSQCVGLCVYGMVIHSPQRYPYLQEVFCVIRLFRWWSSCGFHIT
jgi:hypothetical protein